MDNENNLGIPVVEVKDTQGGFEKDFLDVLKMVAPGTALRTGLDDLLRARMGALIVFDNQLLEDLTEGGFGIGSRFSSQKLVELAKMDGAIVLSRDGKEILTANALLIPDAAIDTKETGTRHKAAERIAKQANTIVLAVSERKNKISLYYRDESYQLDKSSEILRRATETLQILERQKDLFDEFLDDLNRSELSRSATVRDVVSVLQRIELIKRISDKVERYLIELGKEGNIVKMRLNELLRGIAQEDDLIHKDYFGKEINSRLEFLKKLEFDLLLDEFVVSEIFFDQDIDSKVSPKGLRILRKTNVLERHIDSLVANMINLTNILSSRDEDLIEILDDSVMVSFFKQEIFNLKDKLTMGKRL